MGPATIRDILQFTIGDTELEKHKILHWPPDVFAVVGYLLHLSGAYLYVVDQWPPKDLRVTGRRVSEGEWQNKAEELGIRWRRGSRAHRIPAEIREWWNEILRHDALPISSIKNKRKVWQSLVCLCAVSDAACYGLGIPDPDGHRDAFAIEATKLLFFEIVSGTQSTLCKQIHPSKLIVLPKMHTPQKGISLRSMSHHLALSVGSDVSIHWCEALYLEDWQLVSKFNHGVTLLIIPHPMKVDPAQFEPASLRGRLGNMDEKFGFFDYLPRPVSTDFVKKVKALCRAARRTVGRVDGVVLPEMALQPNEYERLRDALLPEVSFVICGVYKRAGKRSSASNLAKLAARFASSYVEFDQSKHHRWALEGSQICQYGLGSTLDPNRKWWENISLPPRSLTFLSLDAWLTISVLICEDLARPDPVGSIVRAVGPNLVVALLQDGPQLASRWSARCATVLADDPGCSVLTLTSAGMSEISRPAQEAFKGTPQPRVIALWKDKDSGTREITLPTGSEAMVLCLANTYETEWTADGRHDHGSAGVLKLAGVHALTQA